MKTILLRAAMSALFLIGSLSMISMAPPPPENTSCKAFYEEFVEEVGAAGISKGQYMSGCNTCLNKSQSAGNIGVCECKTFLLFIGDYEDLEEEYGISNFGECVNYVKNFEEQNP